MFALALTLALLASSASARFMPVHRFASLEGMAIDSDGEASVRSARHALDFAEFDQPLSAADPHRRVARGAAGVDDDDLVGQIVQEAPVMEETPDAAPAYQQPQAAEFVECPEELNGGALSTDDAQFDGDAEATLCEGGLDLAPLKEAADEPGAGRLARGTGLEAEDKVEADKDQTTSSEKAASAPTAEVGSQAEAFPIAEQQSPAVAASVDPAQAEQAEQPAAVASAAGAAGAAGVAPATA